jgi:hypothetical protein
MAVTRIKNNQITDATVNAAAKLQDFSITSGKIANNLTYQSNLTVTGNLTVQGTSTAIDTTITTIEDPIIVLASTQTSGAPAVDIGFLGFRGDQSNIAFVWDESASSFVTAFTSTAESNTTITITSLANLQVGNLSLTGNILNSSLNVTGNITGGNLLTPGLISATANVTGGNVLTGGEVSATANVTGGNVLTGGLVSATANVTGGNVLTGGLISATSTITSAANVTGGNLLTGGLISATSTITSAANITGGNVLTGGLVSATANVTGGNLLTGGLISATSTITSAANITGGNLLTGGLISATSTITTTANITGGNILFGSGQISGTGNVYASNFIGNIAGNIDAAGANTQVQFNDDDLLGASAAFTFDKASNALVNSGNITGGNLLTAGLISATSTITSAANVTGGNLLTGGLISATSTITSAANITGGNVLTAGVVSATANITGGNVLTGGEVSATANVTGGNILTGGLISATSTITSAANITGGNVLTGGLVSAAANVTGGNLLTGGLVSATANVTGGNILTGGLISATSTITSAANITGGNVLTGGLVSATANVTGGNLITGGLVSAAANVTGGNILTAGIVSAGGNVIADNVVTDNVVSSGAMTITTASNGNINIQPNGTGNIVLSNTYVNSVRYPVQDQDAASKIYVDNLVSTAISYHEAVVVATTTTLASTTGGTITYNQPNGASNGIGATLTTTGSFNLIDTANVQTANTRILVKNEANAAHNGIYVWSNATVITRSSDADTYGAGNVDALGINDYFFTTSGNVNKGTAFIVDAPTGTITFGTSLIEFAIFSQTQVYTANTDAGLVLNGTVFSAKVDNNTTAFDGGGNIIVKAGANLTTPNIGAATGTSLNVTANVTGGNITTAGLITATGNVTGGNVDTAGLITATGNVTGGNVLTGGLISATSTITSAANITGGNLLTGGLISATANITGGNVLTGGLVSATANVTGGNLLTGGLISATSTITSAANITGGNLLTGGLISATANVTGGNILTGGLISATSTITSAANVTGGNILTGGVVSATGNIDSGANIVATANVIGGNVTTAGLISATANVTGGNLLTGGQVTATANITGGNLLTGGLISATSTITTTANITGGNLLYGSGIVSGTGNVYAANFIGNISGNIDAGGANTQIQFNDSDVLAGSPGFTFDKTSNAVVANGNITGSNFNTAGVVTATGNVTGGNLLTAGLISATSTITSAANITGGNLLTGGLISATSTITSAANVIGGNISTGGLVTATGNVTGGNIVTGGLITATGNITGANLILTSGTIDGPAAGRVTINGSDADTDFAVDGDTLANVFYVDAGTGTASFGSSTQVTNAIVNFDVTTSIKTPVGNTAQRPATGVTGMIRFNTTSNALEVYDNSQWVSVGVPVFTVIDDEQFNGDGSTVAFTLGSTQTTNSCIVSINGVVQVPTVAYSVSGTDPTCVLTFTEAPLTGDLIDVREITTTTTVTSISNTSGNAIIATSETAAQINITGNVVPSANITYDLGTTSLRWNDLYLAGNSIVLGNTVIKNTSGNTIGFFGPDGTTPATIDAASVDTTTIANGTSSVAVIATNGNIRTNVAGVTVMTVSAGLVDIVGNLSVSGNATLSGNILGDRVQNGTTSIDIQSPNGNANITVGGTSNVAVFATTGAFITGVASVSGNITGGNLSVDTGTVSVGNIVNTNANGVGNIGSTGTRFNQVFALASSAQYADLAEKYTADATYATGTVVAFGGDQEVTISAVDSDRRVAGVISALPSFRMNDGLQSEHTAMVALTGRVPTMVTGPVRKGDMMVSAGAGRARAEANPAIGTVIGKALADHDGADGVIEVVVGRV